MKNIDWSFRKALNDESVISIFMDMLYELKEKAFEKLPFNEVAINYTVNEFVLEPIEERIFLISEYSKFSYIELILSIHKSINHNASILSHPYFEGLEYTGSNTENGVPIYDLILGS